MEVNAKLCVFLFGHATELGIAGQRDGIRKQREHERKRESERRKEREEENLCKAGHKMSDVTFLRNPGAVRPWTGGKNLSRSPLSGSRESLSLSASLLIQFYFRSKVVLQRTKEW